MIITLAQCKVLLGITSTANDTLINALIPEVEAKYLQIRNIPFFQIYGNLISTDKTVTSLIPYPVTNAYYTGTYNGLTAQYLNRLEYLFNATNAIDNYITDIDHVNNTLELDTAASTTADSVIFTVYPQGAKLTAAKMIQYLMNSNSMSGLTGESVGSYSWSASGDGNPFGVPNDIYKSIKRFINI